MQLGEAIPGASQIAARAFGVTTRELDAMVAKGLDATEFVRKFSAQLAKEAPTAADLAAGGFVRLNNEIGNLKDRIAQSGLLPFLEGAANKAASLLNILTQRNAALEAATIGRLGAAANLATPDELRQLVELGRLVNTAPSIVQTGRGAITVGDIAQARTDLEALILEITRRQRTLTSPTADEFGPGRFGERGKAVQALTEQAKAADIKKTLDDYNAILNRQDSLLRAGDEGARKAKALAADRAREDAKHADDAVKFFAERQAAETRYIEQLRTELDRQRLSTDEFAQQQLAQSVSNDKLLLRGSELITQLNVIKEITEAFKAEAEAQKELANAAEEQSKALEKIRDRTAKQIAQEEQNAFKETQRRARDFAEGFTDVILSAREIASKGIKGFVDDTLAQFQRLLVRQYLAPKLNQAVIDLGLKALGLFASAQQLTGGDIAPALPSSPAIQSGGAAVGEFPPRAEGGFVMPNRFYEVGERGPEVLRMGSEGGYVYPAGSGPMGPMNVTFVINARDTRDVIASRGEIRAKMLQTLGTLNRNG